MQYTINELEEIVNEEEDRKKPKAYEYFTILWYPIERPKLFEYAEIYNLGFWQQSPMHESENYSFWVDEATRKIEKAPNKPHIHLICKAANKQTVNAFIKKLCEVLNNDLTGIAINKEDAGINDISKMLRYQLHLNNPYKEHFEIEKFILDCPIYFWSEYAKAFQLEIQKLVELHISEEMLTEHIEVIRMYGENCIISEWLNNRKHLQLVYNLLNDNKRKLKENRHNGN